MSPRDPTILNEVEWLSSGLNPEGRPHGLFRRDSATADSSTFQSLSVEATLPSGSITIYSGARRAGRSFVATDRRSVSAP